MSNKINQVPHFWIIAIIMDLFIVIYNANFIDISGWFPWSSDIMAANGVSIFVLSFVFLIPICYASVIFGLRGTLLTWVTFLAGVVPRTISERHNLEDALRFALFALVALLLGLLISLARNASHQEKALIQQLAPKRWNSVARIIKAQENERNRIARELHDDTIQDLLVIVNHVHALGAQISDNQQSELTDEAEEIESEILRVIDDVRNMSRGLRSSVLDNTGLLPALKWLAESLTQETGIKVTLSVNGKEHKLRSEAEIIIFRIAQEALNNVKQHSKATQAEIILDFAASDFKMTITDNGCGFFIPEDLAGESTVERFGFDRMKQRTKLLGGKLDIQTELSKGTTITLETKI